MTWHNRIRLYGGLLAVLLLVAALVLVFNQRQSRVLSTTGQVVTDQYTVGAAYGGIVLKQDVKNGDSVTKGQPLVTVTSSQLANDVAVGQTITSNDAYDVDLKTSQVTYKALADGVISDVTAQSGAFVAGGTSLGTISAVDSQYAVADFVLSPRDYERIQRGAVVDLRLPDDSSVQGTVQAVSVKTDGGKALTKVTVASQALHDPSRVELTHPGTPVAATLNLRDDGVLAGPTDQMSHFLQQIGLR